MKSLLLISNSTNAGEGYLEYCSKDIADFLQARGVNKALFFPFAAVTFSYDEYLQRVQNKLQPLGIAVESIHNMKNPQQAVREAQAFIVGGGNTFHLLKNCYDCNVIEILHYRAEQGTPYVGWSAGANLACPTICTTNDMPIVQPASFAALRLIPFQINPHYTDAQLTGHAGETREQRLLEYIAANPKMYVAGLREGCMLLVEDNRLRLRGKRNMRVFKQGQAPAEYEAGSDLQFLMEK